MPAVFFQGLKGRIVNSSWGTSNSKQFLILPVAGEVGHVRRVHDGPLVAAGRDSLAAFSIKVRHVDDGSWFSEVDDLSTLAFDFATNLVDIVANFARARHRVCRS